VEKGREKTKGKLFDEFLRGKKNQRGLAFLSGKEGEVKVEKKETTLISLFLTFSFGMVVLTSHTQGGGKGEGGAL